MREISLNAEDIALFGVGGVDLQFAPDLFELDVDESASGLVNFDFDLSAAIGPELNIAADAGSASFGFDL